ncbi:Tim10/DDP family zinc finger-domain-containing protein [Xylaria sp. CBS 124048]|nr:Tim10/DDP family zinc finger-domain-containing protein [Xylaria sp. CBS 124048]
MDSDSIKAEVIRQVRTQYAVANARELISKINDTCFSRCISKPGPTLSKDEQACFTKCMDLYMASWNEISAVYINRLQQDPGK